MRSPQDGLLGEVEPQIVHLPPDVHSLAAAEEAIELADSYGVCRGNPLDDSQRFTLRAGLGERADGSWAASTVADFEPRQNGKNDTCAARELAGLVLFGERLIIHTAHEFATANESFLRLVAVFEAHDDLRKRVARVRYANGEQGIELLNGARLKYKARTGGSGRGFAEADLIVYDESQHLQPEHLAASGPARLANPNSQSWYLGSGGLATSRVAWRMRRRALEGDAGRFAYVEHTAERVSLVDGRVVQEPPADLMDRAAWARANPAYGRRVSDESFLALLGELGPELWARECLCLWDPEPDAADSVIPAVKWSACRNERSGPVDQVDFALDVSPNRDAVCFAVAAQGALGGVHVEVVRHGPHPGAKALCDEAKRLQATHGGSMTLVKGFTGLVAEGRPRAGWCAGPGGRGRRVRAVLRGLLRRRDGRRGHPPWADRAGRRGAGRGAQVVRGRLVLGPSYVGVGHHTAGGGDDRTLGPPAWCPRALGLVRSWCTC
jgi:hypothetical protein